MDEKVVVKLEIKIGGKTIDLTVEEAKKLFESLKGLFGEKTESAPISPWTNPYIPPYNPINPWTNPWSIPNEPIIYNYVTKTGDVEITQDGSTCTSYRIINGTEKEREG